MSGHAPSSASCAAFNRRDLLVGGLIFAATILAYWPVLHGEPLWDDDGHVTRQSLRSLAGLSRIWTDVGATQQYYPVLHTAFWLEHRLWGDSVLGYHLANILLHAGSACLVLAIMRRLALRGAWLGALIFALHPVGVESVAWISEQKNTLSGILYLGSAYLYLDFDRDRRWSRYAAALGLFVLALLAKTVVATLPAALLVVFWWQRGRLSLARDCLPLVPWFGLGLSGGLVSTWVERYFIGAQGADFALTWTQHFLLAGRVVCFYFGKLVWPARLIFIYPRWNLDPADWRQYLFPLGAVAILAGLIVLARVRRGPLAGFLVFAGTLVPVMGFVSVYPFLFSYVADHFQYLASLGVIVPAAAGFAAVAVRLPPAGRQAATLFGVALVVALGVLTWRQSSMYRDSTTLFRQTLARNPECWLAHSILANILALDPSKRPEALTHYEAVLRLKPDLAYAHNSRGKVLASLPGRLPEAIDEFQEALKIDPELAEAHSNLGAAFARIQGRSAESIAHYQAALRLRPDVPDTHFDLANALEKLPERRPEAIAQYEMALRIQPDLAQVHNNLGRVLAGERGRLPEAIGQFDAALKIDPKLAEAHSNLGAALARSPGRLEEAIAHYQAALRLRPDLADTHFDLANALAERPDRRPEAIAQYEEALRLKPDMAEAHYNLGNVLLKSPGRLDEAIAHFTAALKIHPEWESLRRLLAGLQAAKP